MIVIVIVIVNLINIINAGIINAGIINAGNINNGALVLWDLDQGSWSYNRMLLWIENIEVKLSETPYLSGETIGIFDYIYLPFIRQFRIADPDWFDSQKLPNLLISKLFIAKAHRSKLKFILALEFAGDSYTSAVQCGTRVELLKSWNT